MQGTVKEIDETSKKTCNRKIKICRCCNSHLSNEYDSIDLFGKTAQRENVIEKLKEVEKIEVLESDQDLLTTKICRKCFRKVTGIAKAMDEFRNISSQSKEIQISDLNNARLKRGRKPSTPAQEPHGKQQPTTVRDIFPLPAVSEKNASIINEELNKPQAAEILMVAGLRNSQVSVKYYF